MNRKILACPIYHGLRIAGWLVRGVCVLLCLGMICAALWTTIKSATKLGWWETLMPLLALTILLGVVVGAVVLLIRVFEWAEENC